MARLTHAARKEKAKRLQKEVARKIGELTGFEVGKDCPIESRQMGQMGVDIRLDSKARELFPFSVECKNTEKWDVPAAIRQAKANRMPKTDWLVFLCRNNEKPVVVLDADVFWNLYSNTTIHKPPIERKLKR